MDIYLSVLKSSDLSQLPFTNNNRSNKWNNQWSRKDIIIFYNLKSLHRSIEKKTFLLNIETHSVSVFQRKKNKRERILKTFLHLRKIIPNISKTWIYPANIQKYRRERIFGHPSPRTLESKKIVDSQKHWWVWKWYKARKNEWKEINDDKGSDRFKGSHVGDCFRRKRDRIAKISSFPTKHSSLQSTLDQLQTNNE